MNSSFPFDRPQSAATDELLAQALRGCAQHSVASLQRLYDMTAPRLLGLLLQMLGDAEAAEAALQEFYLIVWRDASAFNPQRNHPWQWLRAMARQHAIDQLCAASSPASADEIDASLRFEIAALQEEPSPTSALLGQCLEELSDSERASLKLAYRTGRATQEIARALILPEQGTRQSLRRAVALLVDHFSP